MIGDRRAGSHGDRSGSARDRECAGRRRGSRHRPGHSARAARRRRSASADPWRDPVRPAGSPRTGIRAPPFRRRARARRRTVRSCQTSGRRSSSRRRSRRHRRFRGPKRRRTDGRNPSPVPSSSEGRALKICRPLISRIRKQSALTQWQTRTTAECLSTTRGAVACPRGGGGRDGRHGKSLAGKCACLTVRGESAIVSRRQANFRFAIFWGRPETPAVRPATNSSRSARAFREDRCRSQRRRPMNARIPLFAAARAGRHRRADVRRAGLRRNDQDGRRRADVSEQEHYRKRSQFEGPHHAGRRGKGGGPGRYASGRRSLHRLRADQRGLRPPARGNGRDAAQAREQGQADARSSPITSCPAG